MHDSFVIGLKQTDKLYIICRVSNGADKAYNLRDINIFAELRTNSGYLVERLAVTKYLATGIFIIRSTLADLPVGTLKADIVFENTTNLEKVSSDTITVVVNNSITTGRV